MMKHPDSFIRWGIPGWTGVAGFMLFALIDSIFAPSAVLYTKLNEMLAATGIGQIIITAFLIAGTGVPIGFIIYQIYFYLRWNSPVSRDGLLPPLIVGRAEELHNTIHGLDIDMLTRGEEWRKQLWKGHEGDSGQKDHRAEWCYLSRLIDDALLAVNSNQAIYDQHRQRLNMLHLLGASHLGLGFGFMAYILYKWRMHQVSLLWFALPFVITVISIVLLSNEEGQIKKGHRLLGRVVKYPAELFLSVLISMWLIVFPRPSSVLPYEMQVVVALLVAGIWFWVVKENRSIIITLIFIAICVGIAVQMGVSNKLIEIINLGWSFILSSIVFSCLSLAFLKNRQSARDELMAMEYYYIQRFLSEQPPRQLDVPSGRVLNDQHHPVTNGNELVQQNGKT